MDFWVLGLSDWAEILQACSVGVSSCFRKVFGSRGCWVLVWRALEWEKVVNFRNRGHSFCSKSTWKDSGVGQGW